MPSLKTPKVIVFDLDDTLCGYWQAAKEGLRKTFLVHDEPGQPVEKMLQLWAEEFSVLSHEISEPLWYPRYCESGEATRKELMRRVLMRLGIHSPDLAQAMSDTYYVERHAALDLFPESVEVLERLARKFRLAMITNGPADIQRQELEKLQLSRFFDPILIEGEMKMGKPHPGVMAKLEELTDAHGNEVLMVGNSYKHDIAPAIAAGWQTVWIRRDTDVAPSSKTGKPEELPLGGNMPDLIIGDLRELIEELLS